MTTIGELTAFERDLLDCVLDDVEPTTLILEMLDSEVQPSRESVEAALRDLADRGLLSSFDAVCGDARGTWYDTWWGLTDSGWGAIGLPRPPRYGVCTSVGLP